MHQIAHRPLHTFSSTVDVQLQLYNYTLPNMRDILVKPNQLIRYWCCHSGRDGNLRLGIFLMLGCTLINQGKLLVLKNKMFGDAATVALGLFGSEE